MSEDGRRTDGGAPPDDFGLVFPDPGGADPAAGGADGGAAAPAKRRGAGRPSAPAPAAAATPPAGFPPPAAGRLRGYGVRLREAGEQALAAEIDAYAARVERVARGDLPPIAGRNPSALSPEMVAAALSRRPMRGFLLALETIRNVLIFLPVLWMWQKFAAAVGAFAGGSGGQTFFDFWAGGAGVQPLAAGAREVIAALAALIACHVALGVLRARSDRAAAIADAREARGFAAALAAAEGGSAERRADTPEDAIAAFVRAGRAMATDLGRISAEFAGSVQPMLDAVGVARTILSDVLRGFERQQSQIAAISGSLTGMPEVAERLAGLQRLQERSAERSDGAARSLDAIRAAADERAGELTKAIGLLDDLATRIADSSAQHARASANYSSAVEGFDAGIELFREGAAAMNRTAVRLLEERDGA